MRVLVCIKRVPSPGAKISLLPDGSGIDTRHLGFTMSPHEECAVAEAIRLAEESGGTATVLTVGPEDSSEQLRYAISVGVTEAVLIPTDGGDLDPQATAAAIVSAVNDLEAESGAFGLILFGNESADAGGYQVGIRVARSLGRPVVSGIKSLEIASDKAVARRETADGFEVYELSLPAVCAVKEGISLPRYPTLPGRLKSKKAEMRSLESELGDGGLRMIELMSPPEEISETVILGEGPGAAPKVVDVLEELGVL